MPQRLNWRKLAVNWYIILLSKSDLAEGKREQFIQRFKQLYESNNKPQASALFESRVQGDGWTVLFVFK